MKTLPRVVMALSALAFIAAACASDTGAQWTYAPVSASESEASAMESAPAEATEVTESPETSVEPAAAESQPAEATEATESTEASVEPAAAEASVEPAAAESQPAEPAAAAEARVIDLQANAALRFTDTDGQQLTDIAVTPGETIIFRVDNTAGFPHNFYIGTDEDLRTPAATTEDGISEWSEGVEELVWVVPDDIANLKFGCTVPGHYMTMQGTFTISE